MDAKILQKIQRALNTLILEEALLIKSAVDASINVSFSVPDQKFLETLGNKPVVNCYLMNVEVNTATGRSGAPTFLPKLQDDKSSHIVQMVPKFIDMNYVLSFWSNDEKGAAEIEHLLIGYVISGLGKIEYIPVDILKKHNIDVGSSPVEFVLFGNTASKGIADNIWQSMNSVHKPFIALTVTVPISVHTDRTESVVREINRIVQRIN
jgi:hypothetical protein